MRYSTDRLQLTDQLFDPAFDFVADGPDMVNVLACRIIKDPVFVTFARDSRGNCRRSPS